MGMIIDLTLISALTSGVSARGVMQPPGRRRRDVRPLEGAANPEHARLVAEMEATVADVLDGPPDKENE